MAPANVRRDFTGSRGRTRETLKTDVKVQKKVTEPTVPEEDPFASPVFSITDSQLSVTPNTTEELVVV